MILEALRPCPLRSRLLCSDSGPRSPGFGFCGLCRRARLCLGSTRGSCSIEQAHGCGCLSIKLYLESPVVSRKFWAPAGYAVPSAARG